MSKCPICFQSCKAPTSDDYDDIDYDSYGDFTLKAGSSGNTCSGGKVCCEPKEEPKVIECQSMENHKCVPSNVS